MTYATLYKLVEDFGYDFAEQVAQDYVAAARAHVASVREAIDELKGKQDAK